jgi:methionyl-tRNA formyltransferase
MRIVFIGSVKFSLDMLEALAEMNVSIVGVCTKKSSEFNSDFVDLSSYCKQKSFPWIFCEDINSAESISWISSLKPDVIFCFGWSQIIKREILEIPPLGVFGFHPAALPRNRGRHPIIWALVLGLTETASTFFRMDNGADTGDIVSQVRVEIKPNHDASSLYEEITRIAQSQLAEFVPKLVLGTIVTHKQDNSLSNVWRKRNHIDGEIEWRMSAESIHNLVRGLSKPYVGAHFMYKDNEIKVWKTAIAEENPKNLEPGKILAITQTGTIVKCGVGAICIVETDPPLELVEGEYL